MAIRKFRRRKKNPKKNQGKKKRLNKNQKRMKGRYTKRENKKVDMNQERRLKQVEKKLKDVKVLYHIRDPPYNNWIDPSTNVIIPTWIDVGLVASNIDAYQVIEVTPSIEIPSYFRNTITGAPTLDPTRNLPGMGGHELLNAGNLPENVLLNNNTCYCSKIKCTINWRQFVTSPIIVEDFPFYPIRTEYINNNGLFKIRLYLIEQYVRAGTISDVSDQIARELPGPGMTFKRARERVRLGYNQVSLAQTNLSDKLKYRILYDEVITPKFHWQYSVKTETPGPGDTIDVMPKNEMYLLSILRSPNINVSRKLEFSTAYSVINNNTVPNNFALHWIIKFVDIEQAKFVNDFYEAVPSTNKTQYKNLTNLYVNN